MSDQRSDHDTGGQAHPVSTDAKMLENLRAGHEAAFEALFRRYYGRVYGLLYRLVGSEAEDLAQEVFLRLYRRPPSAPGTDVGAWLYRVAANLGYNALRARRRWRSYRDTLGEASDGTGWQRQEPSPEVSAERAEEHRLVRAALARLKPRQARLLALRYGGLSYREMAEALNVASGSVGTLLARAERAFERVYGELSGRQESSRGE